jgi:hypothetical protein
MVGCISGSAQTSSWIGSKVRFSALLHGVATAMTTDTQKTMSRQAGRSMVAVPTREAKLRAFPSPERFAAKLRPL